jgi:hypothetical protein
VDVDQAEIVKADSKVADAMLQHQGIGSKVVDTMLQHQEVMADSESCPLLVSNN